LYSGLSNKYLSNSSVVKIVVLPAIFSLTTAAIKAFSSGDKDELLEEDFYREWLEKELIYSLLIQYTSGSGAFTNEVLNRAISEAIQKKVFYNNDQIPLLSVLSTDIKNGAKLARASAESIVNNIDDPEYLIEDIIFLEDDDIKEALDDIIKSFSLGRTIKNITEE
jgi:hypothetical protein